jgi:hypothetical protein
MLSYYIVIMAIKRFSKFSARSLLPFKISKRTIMMIFVLFVVLFLFWLFFLRSGYSEGFYAATQKPSPTKSSGTTKSPGPGPKTNSAPTSGPKANVTSAPKTLKKANANITNGKTKDNVIKALKNAGASKAVTEAINKAATSRSTGGSVSKEIMAQIMADPKLAKAWNDNI